MFAKIAVISMLFAVAAADSIDVKGCGEMDNVTMSVEWDACTKNGDADMWRKLTLTSGNVENKTAVATWTTYSNAQCNSLPTNPLTLRCECDDNMYQLMCDAAAGVIPSAILIIAAIMAHLF